MRFLKTDMGLEEFYYSYYPVFTKGNERYEEYVKTIKYLKIIKKDLKRIINYVCDIKDTTNKEMLLNYLNNILNSILVDIKEFKVKDIETLDSLKLMVREEYVIFSVYDIINKSSGTFQTFVIMSRSITKLEISFIKQVPQASLYHIINFKINKDDISMFNTYLLEDEKRLIKKLNQLR